MNKFNVVGAVLLFLTNSYTTAQDTGSNNPLDLFKNEISNYIADAEKKIPREQKFLILKRAERAVLKPHEIPVAETLNLAHQFRKYLFCDDARNLYEKVLKSNDADATQKTIAYRYIGEMEFVDSDNISSAIEYMKKGLKTVPRNTELHGTLLSRLGSYYFIQEDIASMKHTYDEFHRLPEKIKSRMPHTHLKSYLYYARYSESKKTAAEYFDKAKEIANANPTVFDPGLIMSVNVERLESLKWNAPERIKALEKLIRQPRNRKEKDLFPLVLDVYLAYFLERQKDWKRFDKFHKEVIKLLDEHDQLKLKNKNLGYHACQVITTYAFAAKSEKKKYNEIELRNEFLGWSKRNKQVQVYFPQGVSRKEIQQIQEAYESGLRKGLGLIRTRREPQNKGGESTDKSEAGKGVIP